MIEKELAKIVHLFYTKLVLFYSHTKSVDQIKIEPIDAHISIEVTSLNSKLYSDKVVTSTSIDFNER